MQAVAAFSACLSTAEPLFDAPEITRVRVREIVQLGEATSCTSHASLMQFLQWVCVFAAEGNSLVFCLHAGLLVQWPCDIGSCFCDYYSNLYKADVICRGSWIAFWSIALQLRPVITALSSSERKTSCSLLCWLHTHQGAKRLASSPRCMSEAVLTQTSEASHVVRYFM